MDDFQLSPNFSFFELTNSTSHPEFVEENRKEAMELVASLRWHCVNILEPIREAKGLPLIVDSGYRCPALNKAVGGSTDETTGKPKSQHSCVEPLASNPTLFSCATDFYFASRSDLASRNADVAWLVSIAKSIGVSWHQLILEPGCIHLGGPAGFNDGRTEWGEPDPKNPGQWLTKTLVM